MSLQPITMTETMTEMAMTEIDSKKGASQKASQKFWSGFALEGWVFFLKGVSSLDVPNTPLINPFNHCMIFSCLKRYFWIMNIV